MAPPITPAAMPQPRPCAFAELVGTVRLVTSASAAIVVAIFDLVFISLSLWKFRGPKWSSCALVGSLRGKVQGSGRRLCALCEKSQEPPLDWACPDLAQPAKGPQMGPFARVFRELCGYWADTLGCGAPCPADALGCAARIA